MEAPQGIIRHLGQALVCALLAGLTVPAQAETLSQEDVSLSLHASPDGSSWAELGSSTLAGFFGTHRCLCPDTLMPLLRITSTGESKLASSTVTVHFLLGSNCGISPAGCTSLGQVSFSATQTATPPTFSSTLVFQAAAGSSSCSSLKAGSTTLWAVLAQDGVPLPFAATLDLPVITKTVAAPTGLTAQPADAGLLVSWKAPADRSLVSGYQVLCLPPPASAATAGYEICGLGNSVDAGSITPADTTLLCSAKLDAGTTSVRLDGLQNGVAYTVGVVAIDVSGGVSTVSSLVEAMPQPTSGFFEKYKQDGGSASGCALSAAPRRWYGAGLGLAALALVPMRRRRRRRGLPLLLALLAFGGSAQAQDADPEQPLERSDEAGEHGAGLPEREYRTDADPHTRGADWGRDSAAPRPGPDDWAMDSTPRPSSDEWAAERTAPAAGSPPDWSVELGVSWYRPAVDSEFDGSARPFADTFSNSRHLLSEAELVRYLGHRYGAWGVGLRAGYYRVTAAALLPDGTRSGDETGLRLVPFALSLVYRAVGVPGLRRVPLIPYAKVGLDGVLWTVSNTGRGESPTGFTLGWHAAAGLMLGMRFLNDGEPSAHAIADPFAIFFEWDYAAVNGLLASRALHVGDSTWFAGIMFDI